MLTELETARAGKPALVVVSLGSGDMAAHAHGTASPRYDEAFSRLDEVVARVAASLSADEQLVVFGDHGHDEQGRHLPGTPAKTWALYRGEAFRAGERSELAITDHRALLGVALGVPSEPTYRGPSLASVFAPGWVNATLVAGLPAFSAPAIPANVGVVSASSACLLSFGVAAAMALLLHLGGASGRLVTLAPLIVLLAALLGFNFDAVRALVHDHGGEPQRGLWLLVPLAFASVLSLALRRELVGARFLLVLAACVVLTTLLLLPPTAYYYGARRALVLAVLVALVAVLLDQLRRAHAPRRWAPLLALGFVALVMLSFYPVRQLGPEKGGASAWALDASVYTRHGLVTLVIAKLVLIAVHGRAAWRARPVDASTAAGLLSLCVLLQAFGASTPRPLYAAVLAGLAVGLLAAPRRARSSLFAGALVLLVHLFGADLSRLAPLEALLSASSAALWAWPRLGWSRRESAIASGLTLVCALYLMLWPTLGFHLVGIDFAFMFQWLRAEDYERAWWLIGLAVVMKLALPLVLALVPAWRRLGDSTVRRVVVGALSLKIALLAVMIQSYAAVSDMRSQQALAMLAELCLLLFLSLCAVMTMSLLGNRKRAVAASLSSRPDLGGNQPLRERA